MGPSGDFRPACNIYQAPIHHNEFGMGMNVVFFFDVKTTYKHDVFFLNPAAMGGLQELEKHDLAEVRIFDGVGAEMFAKHAFDFADELIKRKTNDRCFVESVECMEHGANSAIYRRK